MMVNLSKIKVPAHMTIEQRGDVVSVFVIDGGPIASINTKERCWDFGHEDPKFRLSRRRTRLEGRCWQQRLLNIVFAELDAARA